MAYTTINKSSEHFNTKLYTGTGSSNALTGVGFQPDWVWFKGRNQAYHHYLFDAVRGVNKPIHSALTNAESTQTDTLMSFDSDGFTLGSDTNNGEINSSGNTFASWNWKANGAGSSNTDGSITSTVSANTTSGFSIVKYTGNETSGATVGHGLSTTPKMIIIKNRNSTDDWVVYHESLGNTQSIRLNLTNAAATTPASFNNTSPTSSVFTLGDWTAVNGSSMIAYCFADKTGYSKFGSYVGNGSADNNAFIYTGFKPAWVMIKNTSVADWWGIIDNKRVGYNPTNNPLFANTSATEGNFNNDLLSHGFKIRSNTGVVGTFGNTYIYIAFAEAPLVGNNNVPCTAR